ncbi:unnamed protein product [Didymodactylos carnosus]|uniref:CCHC-type domain-containing protein n=1 Tax=Didymodactylos carnosus TaxID=1234261 RepID=A0A815HWT8_9BILA|nr:unnamed protein product [Didymodactylos carnosus]CAF1358375.1 unnamed protein product [Didymodactylos carnosus]CAF3640471.1 unnamed protein product [Didymodactylos carnosus]CAF4234358.1 unnamed protein product [Didymodactylos carnosus]
MKSRDEARFAQPSLARTDNIADQRERQDHGNNAEFEISEQAIKFAVEQQYVPIKLVCQPKMQLKETAIKMSSDLIEHIKNDFRKENPNFLGALLFDSCWIDSTGDVQLLTKTTALYVFLCRKDRYPKKLCNIEVTPLPPRHLPPHRTAIIKWIQKNVQNTEIKQELDKKYTSLFNLESMAGTENENTRHVKIELLNYSEYEDLIHSRKISLNGNAHETDEFLPAPKMMICGRCNCPGHTKKNCQISQFDICKRCGKDRTHIQEHRGCQIKCHHCGENHVATSYKCPMISDFRYELIQKLKQHPEKLPPQAQLFIPVSFRDENDRQRTISNFMNPPERKFQQPLNQVYNRSDLQAWPSINPTVITTSLTHSNLADFEEKYKAIQLKLDLMEKRHEDERIEAEKLRDLEKLRIEGKYRFHRKKLNQVWLQTDACQEVQQKMLKKCLTSQKEVATANIEVIRAVRDVSDELRTKINISTFDKFVEPLDSQLKYAESTKQRLTQQQNELHTELAKFNEEKRKPLQEILNLNDDQ